MTTTVYRPSTSSTGDVDITGDISASGTINTVGISSAANATAITIDSSENVGIGIATPDGRLHVQTATAGTVAPNAGADDFTIENSGDCGLSILNPDANNSNIILGSPSDAFGAFWRWNYDADLMTLGSSKTGADFRLVSGAGVEAMRIDGSQNVAIGSTAPLGKLDVDQAAGAGAIPVLYLDQADVSEEFIRFDAAEAEGNSVEDVGAKALTTTKFIRININGADLYLQAGTIA